jgi:hypothetical protein
MYFTMYCSKLLTKFYGEIASKQKLQRTILYYITDCTPFFFFSFSNLRFPPFRPFNLHRGKTVLNFYLSHSEWTLLHKQTFAFRRILKTIWTYICLRGYYAVQGYSYGEGRVEWCSSLGRPSPRGDKLGGRINILNQTIWFSAPNKF